MNDITKIKNEINACKSELALALDALQFSIPQYTEDGMRYGSEVSLVRKIHAKLDRLYLNLGRVEFEIAG